MVEEIESNLADLNRHIERQLEQSTQLLVVTERINAGLSLEDVLNQIYESFHLLIPYDRIGCALLEEGGETVRAHWARSCSPKILIDRDYSAPMKNTTLDQVLENGRPRVLNDLAQYTKERPESESTRLIVEEGMLSSLTCPLIADSKPIGFLFFSSMEAETYRNAHVELFQQIAGQVALAVQKGRLYQELSELSDMRNQFLGIAAHDLRSPIGNIKGFASLLLGEVLGPMTPTQQDAIKRVCAACDHMLPIINDMLDASAIEAGALRLKPEDLDVGRFLAESVDVERILVDGKSMDLRLEIDDALPVVRFDPGRIRQVVSNLVSNAVKYSEPNTTIMLRGKKRPDGVVIQVRDEGQGIAPDQMDRLFLPFSTTDAKPTAGEKSTGLGLAICKRIIEAHQGKIWAESAPGQGSTFSFFLPAKQ
jgi:signal transduction histidine kinase